MLFCKKCQFLDNVCTLPGSQPNALGCRPPSAGVKRPPLLSLKSGNELLLWPLVQLISLKEIGCDWREIETLDIFIEENN